MSSVILNNINNIEKYSYLELGINDNNNFNAINCKNKFSVDINSNAMFTGTTDEYFEQLSLNKKFDIIFIDANHNYDYVLKDFNNAIDHANKWILIHDMIPPSADFTAEYRCSDSYKLLYYFHKEENFELYSTIENYGLTFIKLPAKKVYPDPRYKDIEFNEFSSYISKNVKLYSEIELINFLNEGRF